MSMITCLSVRMLYILFLCPVLASVLTLTIDSQLGTSVEDCFERVSIGERLPSDAIYRNVSELTTKECEQICKQDKQCQTFDYGVGAKGNATCELSKVDEKELKEKNVLQKHPDYDVYVRRFQCEQSPPTPIEFDDPQNGPQHRPVFRPDADEKRPLADYPPLDLRPYETHRPFPTYGPRPTRPFNNYIDNVRPDDCDNFKPDYDQPPSYGAHKPQDIPYKPDYDQPPSYGAHKPQDIPYKPERPSDHKPHDPYPEPPSYGVHRPQDIPYKPSYGHRPHDTYRPEPPSYGPHRPQDIPYRPERPHNTTYKPDPYDVMQFQDQYRPRPERPRPESLRPDPYHPSHPNDDIPDLYGQKPVKPVLRPEAPQYVYIIRPNRKPLQDPRPQDHKPGYGDPDGPIGPPRPYRPRPMNDHNKPTYSYDEQYASNYGANQDNSIYVEIYDPPRPYRPRPDKPVQGTFGYGTQSFDSYSQNSQTSQYGSSYGQKPQKPDGGYGTKPTLGDQPYDESHGSYGTASDHSNQGSYVSHITGQKGQGYGQTSQYGQVSDHHNQVSYQASYGAFSDSHHSTASQYGSYGYGSQADSAYGSHNHHASYGQAQYGSQSDHSSGYGQQNDHSGYRPSTNRPTNQDEPGYGSSNHGSYNRPSSNRPAYGQASQDDAQPGYGNHGSYNKPNRPGYGSNHGSSSQDDIQSGYGSGNQGSYNKPSSNRPSYGNHGSSNQDDAPTGYGNQRPYGSNRPSSVQDDVPGYGSNNQRPYSGNRPSSAQDDALSGYGSSNQRPYGSNHPSSAQDDALTGYGSSNQRPYGSNRPSSAQDEALTGYGSNNQRPYGSNRPSSSQDDTPTGYGSGHRPSSSQDDAPGYGSSNQRPPSSNRPSSTQDDAPGYGSQNKPTKPATSSQDEGYNQSQDEKPGYNQPTNDSGYWDRPDYKPVYESDSDRPGDAPSYIVGPHGEIVTSRPVAVGDYDRPGYGRDPGEVSYKACFRRVLAGRRALRSHVRRVIHCEHLEDCRRECAIEKHFHCESFNYRLDPSFRGKGLCELMTKPIEAFNLHHDFVDDKDYDFYELDRNSLEPNCLDSLRGPGLLHSGYLSSKPSNAVPSYDRWADRADWYGRHKYEDRREGGYRYSNRRYQDQAFVPYQIGASRINDDDNWGQYGGVYGGYGSYYKNWNDYHKSINHWRLADSHTHIKPPDFERTYHGVKPYSSATDFNYHSLAKSRSWDGYGLGFWKRGWSGAWNTLEGEKQKNYWVEVEDRSDDAAVKDCSSRRRPGMSLGTGAIRRSLFARTVVECEAACFGETEFKCVSYSYRYSSSHGLDNCFLSERPYKGLDMSADSGSDVYAMPQDQGCGTVNKQPWIESECFWHVRSGAAVSATAVRAALSVTGLGACEAECIRAHTFFCRGFSFRFDSPSIGDDLENCILTSTPPTSLDTGRGLRPTVGHELYARGNYGRGCEPALYDDVHYRDTQCYLKYDNAAKLTTSAVKGQARVSDERACGSICTDAPFRCLSYSFRSNAPPDADNCLLSEIRLFDLQRGVDYEHSADDWLFAFDLFNGQCWKKVHGKEYEIPSLEVPRPLSAPAADEEYPPSIPDSPPAIETYISSAPSGPSAPGYSGLEPPKIYSQRPVFKPYDPEPDPDYKPYLPLPEPAPSGFKPYPEYLDTLKPPVLPSGYQGYSPSVEYDIPKPSYKPYPDGRPGYKPFAPSAPSAPEYKPFAPSAAGYKPFAPSAPSAPGYKPFAPSAPSAPGYPPKYPEPVPVRPGRPHKPIYGDREDDEIITSWRHYTVSGFPCRKGTTCAQNHVAGHWACEPEGGEIGSWDYCCAPTHRCGYSEGFRKPWCYVGPAHDQWRPCSEKYYPYHQHNVPHPSLGNRDEVPRPIPSRPHRERPGYGERDRVILGPYLSEADRKYWDELYKNGPPAYYDKYGNPLPGYSRVPTEERPHIKYRHNYPRPGSGTWVPVSPLQDDQPPVAGEFGVPRYWPVAYLHKGPPPNMTYFRYNETYTTTEKYHRDSETPMNDKPQPEFKPRRVNDKANSNDLEARTIDDDEDDYDRKDCRSDKKKNIDPDNSSTTQRQENVTTTQKPEVNDTTTEIPHEIKPNITETTTESKTAEDVKLEKDYDVIKGIDDKLHDFTTSIEIFDIEDANLGPKSADLKTVEAEEKQIEAIGRLLASRRGGKVILEKRSQKDLETKNIALDKDFVDFNFGNKFPTAERRGTIQKVSKDEIEKERLGNDKSLEVSETTFVRPPRILSTTENIRKAIVNGKVFYDATIRDQRELFSNSTRKPKNLRLEESRGPSVFSNSNAKKKVVRARNINPIRRVRRVYRKRYNPEEVRKRLLERERSKVNNTDSKS